MCAAVAILMMVACAPRQTSYEHVSVRVDTAPAARVSKGLAKSAWPTARHDPLRTGRGSYVGPASPRIEWTYETTETISEPVLAADGTIYLASDEALTALSPDDGHVRWRTRIAYLTGSPSIGSDNTIYGVTQRNELVELAPDGTRKRTMPIPSPFGLPAQLVIGPDRTIYTAAARPWQTHSTDPNWAGLLEATRPNGSRRWQVKTHGAVTAPAIGPSGAMHVGLSAYSPRGKRLWDKAGGEEAFAVGYDGTLYATYDYGNEERADYRLRAVSPAGQLRWEYRNPSDSSSMAHLAVGGDRMVYVTDSDGFIMALDAHVGRELWRFRVNDEFGYDPRGLAVDVEGTVYVVGNSGVPKDDYLLWAIRSDGRPKWSIRLRAGGPGAAPIIGPAGAVYVATSKLIYSGREEQRYLTTLDAIGEK